MHVVVFLFVFSGLCFFFCCVLVLKLKTERHKKRKLGKTPLARGYGVCFFESTRELYEHFIAVCLAGVWEYEKQNTYLRLLEAWRRASISFFVLVSKKNLGKKLYGGEKSHSRVFGLFFFGSFFVLSHCQKAVWGKRKGNERKRVRVSRIFASRHLVVRKRKKGTQQKGGGNNEREAQKVSAV